MKKNMSSVDGAVRIIIAVIIASLYFAHIINGMVAIILLVLAGVFILTGFIRFCPLYFLFGISTRGKKELN